MENGGRGLDYWVQVQVLLSALVFILPALIAIRFLLRKKRTPLDPSDLWSPCWTILHPRSLLFYRAFAFLSMSFFLYQIVAAFGFFVFFFYTQWTFALVMLYFALATIVSIRGCSRRPTFSPSGNRNTSIAENIDCKSTSETEGFTKLEPPAEGFLDNLLLIIYQSCAGAVVLTDIVFWCLLLPFMTGNDFQLTLLIGCMHSVNAVFLIIETALNRMPFTWFGLTYFVLWSCAYIVFQWALHACCFNWWPYPFLDLSTPWAPLWYLALALVHLPCYGFYVLLIKAKHATFSRMFPHTFVRVLTQDKED